MPKPAPNFSHRFCVDLAGGQVYRQAEKLYEGGAVREIEWANSMLTGEVKGAAGIYHPSLNLRSTVFVENECSCPVGRKGRICSHAIALCLHYEANRSDVDISVDDQDSHPRGWLLEPSKPNLRRQAEAKAQARWSNEAKNFPEVMPAGDPMADCPENKIVVDGSTQYLAIRLPAGGDDSIRPLREIIKTEGFQLEPRNRRWWLRDQHKVLNFLALYWKPLREQWRACFTANFEIKLQGVEISSLQVDAIETEEGFRLDLSLSRQQEPESVRRAMSGGKHYIEEEKGAITLIDRSAVKDLHRIERAVSGQADRPFTSGFSKKLGAEELVAVEAMLDDMAPGWEAPQAWQARSRALRDIGALASPPIPEHFDQRLRSYQRIGVAWLWHLYRHQLGGILADEMGLGKTLQALALVACIRKNNTQLEPALVVCPASLVENWCREAARFTPELRVLKHHGSGRAKEAVALEEADLVVTSYGTLRQDGELMETLDWSVVIGDEAQHIKNRRSQNARTLTRLHNGGRFLLTGTPVENSLEDLYSLFEFLMPGYLTTPNGKLSGEERAWHSEGQSRRAAAYILRRTKQEVAPELPEKIEKTFYCELGSKQQRFYQETLEKTRREIFEMEMAGLSAGRVRFAAFTELLRLRQACVDPRILDAGFEAAASAKLMAFDEILAECLDNGGRMLVFSSFVTALKLLAEHLASAGHRFAYLDGQTKKRLAVCDAFNDDPSIPVFLISLKAGGTGLNLTGADTVLHYDPWWNPAAESQATDRAHRIGQERVVTSIKLIAANTIEEKVLELQKRKAELLTELFEESAAANAKVSIEDIKGLLD
ncbi:MAG: RNA polymerase-associated protein RapA [Opitutia bacterium UBA7350]|nr:MAG: RNA polymerase-associated protein RapA [Opitutae bacterium UBA7350]